MRKMILAIVVTGLLVSPAFAGDWPQWRGPNYDGSTEAKNLPIDFSKTSKVKWVADMPGPGAGTPIVMGDRVFVTAADFDKMQLAAMCYDRETGKQLWRHDVHSGYKLEGVGNALQNSNRTNYASPSPVTDGKLVVFFYGNGDLVAFTVEGKKLWAKNLQAEYGDFTFQWTFSASPTLHDNRLVIPILQRDTPVHGRGKDGTKSFVLALEPGTGEVLWKHIRPSKAKKESLEAYSTPIPHKRADGKDEFIIVGGDVITGHDPATGKEIWRWGTWNENHREQWWRLVPSPVIGGGVVLSCAPKKAPIFATKLNLNGTHEGKDGLAWDTSDNRVLTSDVPTPAYYMDHFYVLSDLTKTLSKVDPKTGKALWTTKMPGRYLWRSSPTGADGKIWCMNHHGDVVVLAASDGAILANIPMGHDDDDLIRASVTVAYDQLFIRTNGKLWCVGN